MYNAPSCTRGYTLHATDNKEREIHNQPAPCVWCVGWISGAEARGHDHNHVSLVIAIEILVASACGDAGMLYVVHMWQVASGKRREESTSVGYAGLLSWSKEVFEAYISSAQELYRG
jgi:hypothetical protein